MTDPVLGPALGGLTLPRPAAGTGAGPVDAALYDLVEARTRRLLAAHPVMATFFGIHSEDERLGDGSRDAVEAEIAEDRRHLAAVEALDPSGLSAAARFERDLELHNVRLSLFDAADVRQWERRSQAAELIGDAVFSLFARGSAPLADRIRAIGARIEGVPTLLDEWRSRARGPQVRLWQEVEARYVEELPGLFAEVRAAAERVLPTADLARLDRAIATASGALGSYAGWLTDTIATGTDDWALGRDRFEELLRLRALGLDGDAILEIGWEQLRRNEEARRAVAREIDPAADVAAVIDRVKSDHPATFGEALEAYRDAMRRARTHLIERGIATVPDDEVVEVIETPEYLRSVMPFAAYFDPARFDADRRGLYVVTPAVDGDPNAMREHYRASISNTSIHEAYPGHHLQLAVAAKHPSLTRMLAEAPEFVEGWGMYSEQMMREEGFDTAPEYRLAMHTDAIWRACRIVLDVRMHRGEVGVDDGTAFMVERTSFEVANARAEVRRYTYTPGYQLSYLLGKVLILGLRDEERRRLGDAFSLRGFHDALLRNGSIPVAFHRRLLREPDAAWR